MKRMVYVLFAGSLMVALSFAGAQPGDDMSENENVLDYADTGNWVSQPKGIMKPVDCFYVYPTVSSNLEGTMDVRNASERALAQGVVASQASVFGEAANVFVPYYRQMSRVAQRPAVPDVVAAEVPGFARGLADVEQAFDYFLEHLNGGRPFILAGHSQGAQAIVELLKVRFGEDEALRSRLIAAYVIGATVTDADLKSAGLSAAQRADDTGVVISYNTQSHMSAGGPMLLPGAHCINPLNWQTDDTAALPSDNLGARFYNDETGEFLREMAGYCDAQVDLETGALLTRLPAGETLAIGPFPAGVYHRYDYALFYRNLQQNVADRARAFQKR